MKFLVAVSFILFLTLSFPAQGLKKINPALVSGGDVVQFEFNKTKTHLYFVADQAVDGRDELFAASLTGGAAYKLSPTFVNSVTLRVRGESQNGQWLYYNRNPSAYMVNIAGGSVVNLGSHLNFSGGIQSLTIRDVQSVGPGSDWILLRFTNGSGDQSLYSVLVVDGVVDTSVGGLLDTGPLFQLGRGAQETISPDGQYVAYIGDPDENGRFDIYTIGIDAGSRSKKTGMPSTSQNVSSFVYSTDGARIIYLSDELTDNKEELFSVPSTGVPFRTTLSGGGVVANASPVNLFNFAFLPAPSGNRVVFFEDDGSGVVNLFSRAITGGAAAEKLNLTITDPNVDVFNFRFDQSGSFVYFNYISSVDGIIGDMYVVPTDHSQTAAPLHDVFPLSANHRIQIYTPAEDPSIPIYYSVFDSSSGIAVQRELYTINADGSGQNTIVQQPTGKLTIQGLLPELEGLLYGVQEMAEVGQTNYFLSSYDGTEQNKIFTTTLANSRINAGGKTKDKQFYFLGTLEDLDKTELFSLDLAEQEELCLPVKAKNNAFAIVCL